MRFFIVIFIFFLVSFNAPAQLTIQSTFKFSFSTKSIKTDTLNFVERVFSPLTNDSVSQLNPNKRPLIYFDSSFSSLSHIQFNGKTTALQGKGFSVSPPYNYFLIIKIDSLLGDIFDGESSVSTLLRMNNLSNFYFFSGQWFYTPIQKDSTKFFILNIENKNDTSFFYINGQFISKGKTGSNSTNGITLGSIGNMASNFSKFKFLELTAYDTALSNLQRIQIHNELFEKYHRTINFKDTIILNSFCNQTYFLPKLFKGIVWSNGDSNIHSSYSKSGKYWVQYTNIFGEQHSDTFNIQYPELKFINNQTICNSSQLIWNTNPKNSNFSFLWQDGSTDSALTITQPGDYWVQVTDSFGCSITSDTVHIEVDSFAVKASLGADRSLCQGNMLELQEGRTEAVSYQWSTGDTLPYLTIQNPGTFAVTTTNSLGCVAEDTVTIGIKGLAPTPQFTKQNACLGDSVSFTDQSVANPGNIIQWSWDFGDGTTDSVENPSHLYLDTGYYEVSLTVVTDSGCEASVRDTITIYPNPVADFTIGFSCENLETVFSDASTSAWDSVVSWSWDFGDGNSSNAVAPIHIYQASQNFTPQLVVSNSFGCLDSITKTHFVKPSPTAQFSVSPPCVNDSLFIQETATGDSITHYQWTLWNNFQFSGTGFSNVFTATGNYPLQLQVTDSNNCWDTLTQNIAIRNHPSILNQLTDTQICLFDTLLWSLSYPANAFTFLWQDGSTNPNFQITQAGNYWYEVTDSVGCASRADSIAVSINSFPQQINAGPDTSLCKGETIHILNPITQLSNILWNTGDTTEVTAIDSTGDYFVQLTDTMGCSGSDTAFVFVRGEKAIVQMQFDTTCILDSTQFFDRSILAFGDTINSWNWDFGNNLIDSVQNPKTYYPATGVYPIKLSVLTNDNCYSEGFDTIQIYHLPSPSFVLSKACEDREVYFQDQSTTIDGTIASRLWSFGDPNGTNDTSKNPIFIYDTAITAFVTLKVTNSWGCQNQTAQSLKVDFTPRANMAFDNHCLGVNQTFQSNSVTNTSANFFWNFGDGIQSQGQKVVHQYDTLGDFTVRLIVEEATGCIDTAIETVSVFPLPEAKPFTQAGCINAPLVFDDSSQSLVYPIAKWSWIQNGMVIDTGKTFNLAFADSGSFELKILIENTVGCKDSANGVVSVLHPPTTNFEFEPTFGAAPLEVSFFNLSAPLFGSVWRYNDSIVGLDNNLDFTITENGVHTIELVALNAIGCRDSISKQLKVLPPVLDLAIENLGYDIQPDGFMEVRFEVSNQGTRNVDYFEVKAETERGQNLKEIIEVSINSGETKLIVFKSLLELGPENNFGWLCLGIENVENEGADDNASNNRSCISQETFVVRDLYPNPTNKLLNIDLIAGEVETLDVVIYSKNGSEEALVYHGETRLGLNSIVLDVSKLPVGVYHARIIFKGEQVVRSFVVGE